MSLFSFLKIDQSKLIPMMIRDWILSIKEKPGKEIIAFNFGIFQDAGFKNNYAVYLIGSKKYDESSGDWACEPDFEPKFKYLRMPGTNKMTGEEILEIIKQGVSSFLATQDFGKSLLSNADAITVGFDEGDLFRVK